MDTNEYEFNEESNSDQSFERRLKLQNMATSIALLSSRIQGQDKQGSKSGNQQNSGNRGRSSRKK
jgi:hypothetical protein